MSTSAALFLIKSVPTAIKPRRIGLPESSITAMFFRRLDERAKVFIEYGPAETAWVPVTAPNFLNINCFWVSGKYKKNGNGKALLKSAIDDATEQGKDGLVTVVGTKKFHFMSDTKWFLKQGFEEVERISSGFSLLAKKLNAKAPTPMFNDCVKSGECEGQEGHRCVLFQPLSFCRVSCQRVTYGGRREERAFCQIDQTGNHGGCTERTEPGHHFQFLSRW